MPYPSVDLTRVKTYPLVKRENRVALEDLIFPTSAYAHFDNPELLEVSARIAQARKNGKAFIFMFGAHVIKRGLAPLLIDLLKRGVITHLASNGAATIHDFEIALQGHTSEDVVKSLEDGSFGMAEETGLWMNQAIQGGANQGLGIGEALGRLIAGDPRFITGRTASCIRLINWASPIRCTWRLARISSTNTLKPILPRWVGPAGRILRSLPRRCAPWKGASSAILVRR